MKKGTLKAIQEIDQEFFRALEIFLPEADLGVLRHQKCQIRWDCSER